jgi:ergothioneine biosynthesis protein EgtB
MTSIDSTETIATLAKRFSEVRAVTLSLAARLSEAECSVQSMPDASPVKWHMAHTTWFFETFLLERFASGSSGDYVPFDASYRVLFNSYYESVGEQFPRAERGLIARPGLAEVKRYRAVVDAAIHQMLADPELPPEALPLVELGLQHEQQHQELIVTDVKHALSMQPAGAPTIAASDSPGRDAPTTPAGWHAVEEGLYEVGFEGGKFSFDNERPRHRVFLEAYELATRPVSNQDWLAFMEAGGYQDAVLWLSDGWATAREAGWEAPLYWFQRDGEWWSYTLAGVQPIRWDEPVCHVSYYEAEAFATWACARLPTEAEWEVGSMFELSGGNFLESWRLHPEPRAACFGDVWEWTASPYVAYPRYRKPTGALGEYNGKFMADQWVLRGGSCATPRSHIRPTYRNFFPAPARWQFSGLRLARDRG